MGPAQLVGRGLSACERAPPPARQPACGRAGLSAARLLVGKAEMGRSWCCAGAGPPPTWRQDKPPHKPALSMGPVGGRTSPQRLAAPGTRCGEPSGALSCPIGGAWDACLRYRACGGPRAPCLEKKGRQRAALSGLGVVAELGAAQDGACSCAKPPVGLAQSWGGREAARRGRGRPIPCLWVLKNPGSCYLEQQTLA